MSDKRLTEADVRALRDLVYGQSSTDRNWEACKEEWMRPENLAWLQAQKPHRKL